MARLILVRKRAQQPQQAVAIDWSNPITLGLSFAWCPSVGDKDLVSGVSGTPEGAKNANIPTAAGLARNHTGVGALNFGGIPGANFAGLNNQTVFVTTILPVVLSSDMYFFGRIATAWDYGLSVNKGAGQIFFGTGGGTGATTVTVPPSSFVGGLDPYQNRPLAICGTYDKSFARLYIDGLEKNSAAFTGSFPATSDPFAIGSRGGGGQSGFYATGLSMGLVLLFKRTLTPSEVKSLSENPWQIFKGQQRQFYIASTDAATGVISANGSSIGSSELTATSAAIKATFGNGVGLAGGAATGASVMQAAGAALGTSSLEAVANIIAQSTGATAGTSVAGGAARSVFNVVGSSSGSAAASSTAVSITQATGYTVGTGSASASAVSISTSSGTSTGTAILAGSGAAIWRVDGSAAGIALVSGSGNAVVAAANSTSDANGTAIGTSVATATSGKIAGTSGTASGSANVIGQGQTLAQAIAQALGTSTASAGGVLIAASVGAGNGSSNAAGAARMVAGADGSAAGSSSAQSIVVIIHESAGMSLGASAITAVSGAIRAAIGAANGKATINGITEGGVHYTAQGDLFNITLVFSQYAVSLDNKQYNMELDK